MTTLGSNDVVGDASRVVAVTDNRTPQFKLGELLFEQKQCVQASSLPLAPWEVGNDDVVVATRALPISPVVYKIKGIAFDVGMGASFLCRLTMLISGQRRLTTRQVTS